MGKCTRDIPISQGYVDAQLRTFKETSPPRPCSEELIVHANEAWIRVGKTLDRVPAPDVFPASHEEMHLFDFSKAGIYTQLEVDAWKRNKEVQGLHKMITTKIAHGACAGEDLCEPQPHITPYDLSKLTPAVSLDPFSGITTKIRDYGTYISLLVLTIEAIKLLVFMVMVFTTLIQEGIQGLIALIMQVICCNSVNSYRRIRRNKKRFECRQAATHGAYVMTTNPTAPLMKAKEDEVTTTA